MCGVIDVSINDWNGKEVDILSKCTMYRERQVKSKSCTDSNPTMLAQVAGQHGAQAWRLLT